MPVVEADRRPPSKMAGLLYGLGFGGFIDGIVLHQVFQWHHMVSDVGEYPMTTLAGLEVNTLADGFFHLATWALVFGGSVATLVAWRQGRLAPSWSFHFLVVAGRRLHRRGLHEVLTESLTEPVAGRGH
ncbi:MAG TPA: DUF2243 domain-containing protein [Nocardioidaceae bacterium]|nr:DUF2243 domain-containing protein [Nocardioidaceae bacterium]